MVERLGEDTVQEPECNTYREGLHVAWGQRLCLSDKEMSQFAAVGSPSTGNACGVTIKQDECVSQFFTAVAEHWWWLRQKQLEEWSGGSGSDLKMEALIVRTMRG